MLLLRGRRGTITKDCSDMLISSWRDITHESVVNNSNWMMSLGVTGPVFNLPQLSACIEQKSTQTGQVFHTTGCALCSEDLQAMDSSPRDNEMGGLKSPTQCVENPEGRGVWVYMDKTFCYCPLPQIPSWDNPKDHNVLIYYDKAFYLGPQSQ